MTSKNSSMSGPVSGGAGLRPGPLDADWMPPDNLLEATSDLSVTLGEVHRLRAENARLREMLEAVAGWPFGYSPSVSQRQAIRAALGGAK